MQRVKTLLFRRGMLGSAMLAAFFTISTSPAAIACIVPSGTNTPALVAPELFGGSTQGLSPDLSVPTESHSARSFVGLWYGTVSADGQSLYAGFETFHSDGTEILVDAS